MNIGDMGLVRRHRPRNQFYGGGTIDDGWDSIAPS
jgi:hypothetical protein